MIIEFDNKYKKAIRDDTLRYIRQYRRIVWTDPDHRSYSLHTGSSHVINNYIKFYFLGSFHFANGRLK